MTSSRETADVLARARAARPGAPAPRSSSPSSPPVAAPGESDEPRSGSPEDGGYVHAPAPRAKPAPAALVLEGVRETGDPLCPWLATLRRPDGRARDVSGKTEAEARARASAEIRAAGGGR